MTCEHAFQDASYVLGALSAAERSAYQRHLEECDECSRSVRMLAGMPGLLARVPDDVLELARPDAEPVPSTLLPALVEQARRHDRRRTWLATALASAAAVAVIAGSVVLGNLFLGNLVLGDRDVTPAAPAPSAAPATEPAVPMYAVRPLPVTAEISLTGVSWGTRLDLTCSYKPPEEGERARSWRYALVVQSKDGTAEQVATWVAKPGRTFEITGATASPRDEIAVVEVQTPDGETLLRLHT